MYEDQDTWREEPRDPNDLASLVEQRRTEHALESRDRPPAPVDPEPLSAEDYMCDECDDWIPSRRRHAGYTICVPCREAIDREEGAARIRGSSE
jgi:RNA polymerase-binding transcription factor DksA